MRSLILLLAGLFASALCSGQITGNPNVKDPKALQLDSAKALELIGTWKCTSHTEDIKGSKETIDNPEIILELKADGNYTERRCVTCQFFKTGIWQIKTTTIQFSVGKSDKHNTNKLEGVWAVYELTDKKLMLTKILTSSGDWKKEIHFERLSPTNTKQ